MVLTVLYLSTRESVFDRQVVDPKASENVEVIPFPITSEKIPQGLKWQNGMKQKTFSSSKATKGGTWELFLPSYPNTFRQVGQNANGSFRRELDNNDMFLVDVHPETDEILPSLAKEWAIGDDKRTVYFKLDPDARWSDGKPVVADDYVYMLKQMRAPNMLAPWYFDYYASQVESVLKFDDYTIAVRLPTPKADLVETCAFRPKAYHFYGKMITSKAKLPIKNAIHHYRHDQRTPEARLQKQYDAFIKAEKKYEAARTKLETELKKVKNSDPQGESVGKLKEEINALKAPDEPTVEISVSDVRSDYNKYYNWKVAPKVGPYTISSFIKGKEVVMSRNKNWWAKDKKYYKNRYNVDFVRYRIIRDLTVSFEHFRNGNLDTFGLTLPDYWHDKAKYMKIIEKGYAHKVWFNHAAPMPNYLLTFNTSNSLLKDKRVREGIVYSLNLEKMIRTTLRGDYELANTFHEGYGDYSHPKLKSRRFNANKAIELFTEAGFTKVDDKGIRYKTIANGNKAKLSFQLLYSSSSHTERLLTLKNEALKLGVELDLATFDSTTVFKVMQDKKHEIAWHGWGASPRPNYFGQYHSSQADIKNTNNLSNVKNEKLTEMIDQYRYALDKATKVRLAHSIEEKINELCVSHPTYKIPYFREVVWNWVKYPDFIGTRTTADSITDYGLFWIDTKLKEEILKAKKRDKSHRSDQSKMVIDKRYKK